MQFPTIPSQKVAPVTRSDIAGVSAVAPISPGQVAVPDPSQSRAADQPPPQIRPQVERRQGSRRDGPDRRRRQVPVLLDTRTGRDRRGERQRTDDPPAVRVDHSA
jgi:hypothetical protein